MDFGILFLLFSLFSIRTIESMNFTENEYQSGIIFQKDSDARTTYDSFSLVYYADLQQFYGIKDKIQDCYLELKRLCQFHMSLCEILYATVDRRLAKLDKNEADIGLYQLHSPKRPKRAAFLAAMALAGSVFGLINSIRGEMLASEIENIRGDESAITKIQHDGLLFLKENIVTEKKAFLHLNNVTDIILKDFREMEVEGLRTYTRVFRNLYVTRIEQLINHWFLEHEYASELILNHLHSAMYGRFSHLIEVRQFEEDLKRIEKELPDQQQLPINIYAENPLNIFKFSTIKASLFDSKLLIEIIIPKVDRELYTLYKVIPIPIHSNGFMNIIVPSMEFVLIDQSTANFIPIISDELHNNPLTSNSERIISPYSNIFHDFRDNCEMTIKLTPHSNDIKQLCNFRTIPSSNYFISLNSFNNYYISLFKPTNLIEFCPGKPIKPNRITSSGFLTLSENCKIQTDKITLRPRIKTIYENHSEIQIIYDLANITAEVLEEQFTNITRPSELHSSEASILIDDHLEDFDDLANRADELIDQISDRNISENIYQDKIKHSLFLVIGIFTVLLIILILFGYYLHSRFYNIGTWVKLANKFNEPATISPSDQQHIV